MNKTTEMNASKKTVYVSPEIEVIQFCTEDIICTSVIEGDPDNF